MKWIIPCNVKYYDVIGVFKKFAAVNWKQGNNIEQGDIVYIYVGQPWQQIRYKCIAMQVNLQEATIDDSEFILDGSKYVDYGRYMQLKVVEEYRDDILGYSKLKQNGLTSVQGPSRASEELENYIEETLKASEYAYPLTYRSPIGITTGEWEELLEDNEVFSIQNIELLKRIYLEPQHATTCHRLAEEDGVHSSSYTSGIVRLAKRIAQRVGLRELKGTDGHATWWRVLFWGKELEGNRFEWKLRPELAYALVNIYPQLEEGIDEEGIDIEEIQQVEQELDGLIHVGETEKQTVIKTRIGHGTLKKHLIQQECQCRICGLQDGRFLIASHIKPWCVASNEERLDLDNVLLLCPHHDAAFDKGYISFDDEGRLLVSSELAPKTILLLNVEEGIKIRLNNGNQQYMKWHREHVFIE